MPFQQTIDSSLENCEKFARLEKNNKYFEKLSRWLLAITKSLLNQTLNLMVSSFELSLGLPLEKFKFF